MRRRTGLPIALQSVARRSRWSKRLMDVMRRPPASRARGGATTSANVRHRVRNGQAAPRHRPASLTGLTVHAVLLVAAPLLSPSLLRAQHRIRLEMLDSAVLAAPRLHESSGLAPSSRVAGIVWTHNDS